VARDTRNAIKSGFFYGWLSLIEGIIIRIENEYGNEFSVIFPRGLSGPVVSGMERPVNFDTPAYHEGRQAHLRFQHLT
jgi:pantothenate kinase type III